MHYVAKKLNKGFTLIEVIISLFVFVIIMVAVSDTFTSGFSSYKNTKAAQKNVENAQFAMNLMAKELRTSTIVSPTTTSTVTVVRFYDYSQNSCLEYEIDSLSKELKVAKKPIATPSTPASDCAGSLGTAKSLVKVGSASGALLTGNFRVTPSAAGAISGKVTISLQIKESDDTEVARIQTSVSLRDYGVSF